MAERILANGLPDVSVKSAGLGALIGHQADPMAQELMGRAGLKINQHVARQITSQLCKSAEIILVMDSDQKRFIEDAYPFARGKVFRIAESLRSDVPDPYRKSIEDFRLALELIEQGSSAWISRIKKINERERQST